MKLTHRILVFLPLLIALVPVSLFFFHRPLNSAPPTSVRDVLSSSQLSYFARIVSSTTGQSVITIGNTAPSMSTSNLSVGDTIAIGTTGVGVGTSGPLTKYTVKDIGTGNTVTIDLNTGIGQSNSFVNAAVIATRSAIHTFYFTPQSNITGGYWQFLIKSTNRTVGATESPNDGIPDQQGFDLGQDVGGTTTGVGTRLKVADVSCPNFATGVGGTVASSIGTTTVGSSTYHVINCYMGVGGTNQIGVGYTAIIGRDLSVGSQLINPAPSVSHIEGISNDSGPDVYNFLVRHLNSSAVLQDADTVQGRIAVIEAVRITATVDPTLSFSIDTTNIGTTACGNVLKGNNSSTTATAVPFGSLSISSFNDLAQRLSVITNGNAYVVTVYQNNRMRNLSTGTTIPDTNCDGACSPTTHNIWTTDTTESGLGYSIQNVNVGTTVFHYTSSGAYTGKAFGTGSANAQNVMTHPSGTAITQTEVAYMCYRLVASSTQEAGNYENQVIYTATATF